jgi:hypothetical protein
MVSENTWEGNEDEVQTVNRRRKYRLVKRTNIRI